MKKNVGNGDRFFRVIIGIIALIIGISGFFEGLINWILLGVGAIMVVTASIQFCPLYTILGINTCKVKSKK